MPLRRRRGRVALAVSGSAETMHKGRFPARYVPGETRLCDPRIPNGAPDHGPQTRRSWLLGVGALLCTSAVAAVGMWGNRKPTRIQPPRRGTLAWALAMGDATDAQLVLASGDLEMVSAQHRSDTRLLPVFERLLNIALDRDQDLEYADVAGACAIRSLARLGHPQVAMRRQEAITNRANRPETRMALDGVLRRFGSDHDRPGRRR